jgi:hypothetical protein
MPLSSSIACRLQFQHLSIREIIRGLSDDDLRRVVNPGKWNAHAHIAHLAAYQPVFISRLERISLQPVPAFGRYVAEEDPLFPGYLERSVKSLLEQIDTDRARILSFLDRSGEPFFGKTASHPRFGLLTVVDWTEFFLLHEAHHLYTLFALVRSPKQ